MLGHPAALQVVIFYPVPHSIQALRRAALFGKHTSTTIWECDADFASRTGKHNAAEPICTHGSQR